MVFTSVLTTPTSLAATVSKLPTRLYLFMNRRRLHSGIRLQPVGCCSRILSPWQVGWSWRRVVVPSNIVCPGGPARQPDASSIPQSGTKNWPSGCRNGGWRCGDGSCLPPRLRCDGVFQCRDLSDELGMNTMTLSYFSVLKFFSIGFLYKFPLS